MAKQGVKSKHEYMVKLDYSWYCGECNMKRKLRLNTDGTGTCVHCGSVMIVNTKELSDTHVPHKIIIPGVEKGYVRFTCNRCNCTFEMLPTAASVSDTCPHCNKEFEKCGYYFLSQGVKSKHEYGCVYFEYLKEEEE